MAALQHGEVLILEGDDDLVGEVAAGPALTPAAIANLLERVYEHVADDFDMIVVSTTFVDALNPGAYYMADAPAPSARAVGFIDMNQVGSFGDQFAPVLAQEWSHAWLVHTTFVDPATGLVSDELLGRDLAHWSARVDADGSFQDGVDWVDNGDGTFTVAGFMERFSALDLWTIGLIDDAEVPDFFILRTDEVARTARPPLGLTVTADKLVVTLADVIAADGPQPPVETRQHDFRIAFVLVTDRGESAESARPLAAELDAQRAAWTAAMPGWLWDRGTMCTDLALACAAPHLAFETATASEAAGDGDGVIEPGETAAIAVTWRNTGADVATGGAATLELGWPGPPAIAIPDVAAGASATSAFELAVPATAACGESVVIAAVARLGEHTWRGDVALTPGLVIRPVPSPAAWVVDAHGEDTATVGGWAYGIADAVVHDGRVLQPSASAAWWTGLARGAEWKANDLDGGTTSLTSPSIDAAGLATPAVRYRVWLAALDFGVSPPASVEGDDLIVEASDDAGATWREIDRVSAAPPGWTEREASLTGVDQGRPILLRFIAEDADAPNLVEVGLAEVEVVGLSDDCAPTGCGCQTGVEAPELSVIFVVALLLRRGRG